MVRFVRVGTIRPGKIQQALAFANEIAGYVRSKIGVPVNIFLQSGGVVGRICWQADYPDLGAIGTANRDLLADPEFVKRVEEAADLFIAGEMRDSFWTQL
jgi:hypothetical protein